MDALIRLSIAFFILGLIFYSLERLFPAVREKPLWRKDSRTDLIYWFFTPLVTKSISRGAALAAVVVTALLIGRELSPSIAEGFGPIPNQPGWLIAIEMLMLGDLIGYWMHRLFHGRRLWKFHAIHHSSTQLDWLSSIRLHPVNDLITRVAQVVPLVCLGFPLTALAVYVPFIGLYAIYLHANLDWSYGPARYLIASPRFHRWHHTAEHEGLDKNFAGLLPVFDLIFGTFYMPDRKPVKFGDIEDAVPKTFLGQLVYPFRKTTNKVA